jgi:hypothetical protein
VQQFALLSAGKTPTSGGLVERNGAYLTSVSVPTTHHSQDCEEVLTKMRGGHCKHHGQSSAYRVSSSELSKMNILCGLIHASIPFRSLDLQRTLLPCAMGCCQLIRIFWGEANRNSIDDSASYKNDRHDCIDYLCRTKISILIPLWRCRRTLLPGT